MPPPFSRPYRRLLTEFHNSFFWQGNLCPAPCRLLLFLGVIFFSKLGIFAYIFFFKNTLNIFTRVKKFADEEPDSP
jgi:hypothetical protein